MIAKRAQAKNPKNSKKSQPPNEVESENLPAWEMIENGRYRPRRFKGSCRGRELG